MCSFSSLQSIRFEGVDVNVVLIMFFIHQDLFWVAYAVVPVYAFFKFGPMVLSWCCGGKEEQGLPLTESAAEIKRREKGERQAARPRYRYAH